MADDVQPAIAEPVEGEPSSHETCGRFPAQEVAQTFPGSSPDPQTAAKSEAKA